MQRRYTADIAPLLNDPSRRDVLIGNPTLPSCTVMCKAYGQPNVSVIVEGYLAAFGDAMGATYTGEQLKQIAGDVLSAYHYFTLAEVLLALKMGREGKFRDAQGNNVAKTYGTMSAAVVLDVLYYFNKNVRFVEIDRRERNKVQATTANFAEFLQSKELQRRLNNG